MNFSYGSKSKEKKLSIELSGVVFNKDLLKAIIFRFVEIFSLHRFELKNRQYSIKSILGNFGPNKFLYA